MKLLNLLIIGLVCCLASCGWLGKASDTISNELDPSTLLKRYEWFKNVSAECDKKMADIQVYKSRLSSLENSYKDIPRNQWDRTDKEQYNLWTQEVAGTVASYNSLAAEYNAAMAKINYRFTNIGDLPEGAQNPLPREIKSYQYE